MRVLFVNHKEEQCGVQQFGRRVYDLAKSSTKVEYTYIEPDSMDSMMYWVNFGKFTTIIYNWYPITMPWLPEYFVTSRKDIKHYFLYHDGHTRTNYDKYIFAGSVGKDISMPYEKMYVLPRPLFKYNGDYATNERPTIGSFGFGAWQKGFTNLVEKVNDEFDSAVINIHMPCAYFGDSKGIETAKIADKCRELNRKKGIELNITHNFFSDNNEVLKFLAGNDINIFMYHAQNQGLSSAFDYAISVERPVGITDDSMFKHAYREEIDAEKHSIRELLGGRKYRDELYRKWNPDNFSEEMDKIYDN